VPITRKIMYATVGIVAIPSLLVGAAAVGSSAAFASTGYSVLAMPALNERAAPSTSAAIVGRLPYRSTITISCQTTGSSVNGSSIWDELPGGRYVSDYWIDTPAYGQFSPGLVRCGTQPAPAPGPSSSPPTVSAPAPSPGRAVGVTTNHNEGSYGECTEWAIAEFHAHSGLGPDFTGANDGNARYWAGNAQAKGWTVVATPEINSVAVFQPGDNGAFGTGHVAWVTAVSGNSITVSEMNFDADGGGWNRVDSRTMVPAGGVRYILAP
jgi:surface antigen